jgi:hypothetical protein
MPVPNTAIFMVVLLEIRGHDKAASPDSDKLTDGSVYYKHYIGVLLTRRSDG